MKRLLYLIPVSVMAVLLLAAPALTQTAPNDIKASPTQTTDAVQETGGAATDPTPVPAETTTTPAGTTAPTESTTPAPNSTTTVDIRDLAFNPAQLNVAPGTTVRFVNNDTVPHTATADNGLFDTGSLAPGYSFDVFLDGAGTVTYHCELHPDMQGSIVVGEPGQAGGTETTNPPNQAVSVYP